NRRQRNGKRMATPLTLYWLKQTAGKSTLPRRAAILPVQCSISLFIFFIAACEQLPLRCHCRFSSFSENPSAFVPGSFPESIGVWRNATLPLRLEMKNHQRNCVVFYAAIFSASRFGRAPSVTPG